MITKIQVLFISLFFSAHIMAQNVPIIDVPNEIEFAGMRLKLTNGAQKIIQKDINAITKNARYFQTLVDRANLYFPLIDKVFEEESFPKDFKFLALQESSLISNAVSSSNAVGFWQFKKESAIEVGLRVDHKIDERMNIIASSRGAARYLKRNNQTYNNWIYSILSYNLGLTGAKSQTEQAYIGANKMTIDENMHWYVMRFLAHKLAFQHAIEKAATMDSILVEYIHGANKSLSDIALEHKLDIEKLSSYNKWLKTDIIPEDKIYSVILSVPMSQAFAFDKSLKNIPTTKENKAKKEKYAAISDINFEKISTIGYIVLINGVKAIIAQGGDNSVKLSAKGGISKDAFLNFNEMKSFDDVIPGRVYYLSKKKKKALVMFHTVQYDETLWDIAQNYGLTTEAIRSKNRMDKNEAVDAGRVLWIRTKRPKDKNVEYKEVIKKENSIRIIEPNRAIDTTIIIKSTEKTNSTNKESDNFIYHTVQAGESMFGIAKKYQTTTDSILTWNTLSTYGVNQGQKLIVGSKLKKIESLSYTVVAGDTFYKIAKQHNVSVNDLMLWNNKTDMTIKPGELLLIKKTNP